MTIPHSFIQELLTRVDVVELVGQHVQLKKGGANYMGLCPFHSEKSPSFSVSPTKQFYHCFGCGKNGDAITFLMEQAGLDFVDAVQELAQRAGLAVPEQLATPGQREAAARERATQQSLTEVLETAAQAYRTRLRDSPAAIAYCKQRGLSGAIAQRFGLGYAPAGWRTLAGVFAHYEDPQLVQCGLVITDTGDGNHEAKRYDRFRDRLMFPIRNLKGDCIGFGGRVLGDEKPKYLNSPETPVFSKGHELYGLFEARQAIRDAGYVLVTEGYMDVVALAQHGFAQAVATLGTACTEPHVHKLFRVTDHIVFSFDGDAAGRRAARKALEVVLPLVTDARRVRFLFLPPDHDPDSYIRAHGAPAFGYAVTEATALSRFLLDTVREGCDLATPEGRAALAHQAQPLWQRLPAGMLQRQLLGELATLLQLPTAELARTWKSAYSADAASAQRYGFYSDAVRPGASPVATPGVPAPRSRADYAVRLVLERMALLEQLTEDDHHLLRAMPPPHGTLLGWLEAQLHEHGPQPWAALREGLRGHANEAFATTLMDATRTMAPQGSDAELLLELREILRRQRIDALKAEETAALAALATDAGARERYQKILTLRRALEEGQPVPDPALADRHV